MKKMAIVGSVSLADNKEAYRIINEVIEQHKPTCIVSGGAKGIDTMAENTALSLGLETEIYRPTVPRWEDGYKPRNLLIVNSLTPGRDVLVRIVAKDSRTYGSGWTRDRAQERGVQCYEYKL